MSLVVLRGHQRDPVLGIRIEIDPRDVALLHVVDAGRVLVTLEDKMLPVVVRRVRPLQSVLEDEVRVLVGLRLLRLGHAPRHGHHLRPARIVASRDVLFVAEVGDERRRVLESRPTLGPHHLLQLLRELRRRCIAGRFQVRLRDTHELRAVRGGRGARRRPPSPERGRHSSSRSDPGLWPRDARRGPTLALRPCVPRAAPSTAHAAIDRPGERLGAIELPWAGSGFDCY